MRKCLTGLFVILIFAALTFSQDWTGQGRQVGFVYDEEGNPLEGVKIKLLFVKTQSGFETETDKKGKWAAMGVKGGTWFVDFELVGYAPRNISITILDYRQVNKQVEIRLKKVEGLFVTEDMKEEYKRGIDLFNEGKYKESIPVYSAILEKFPDAYIIHLSMGHSYFQLENYDEAEKNYLKVLEHETDHVDAIIGVGNCFMNKGDSEKAMEWYSKIAFEKIENQTVLYNVGTIFYNNSKFDEALTYYKRAVEIQEDFVDAIYQLGLTYLAKGNNAEALRVFENYLEHDPDSPKASQVQGFIDYLKKQ